MNYKVIQKKHKWAVVETQTDLIIEYCLTREAARKLTRNLNLGAGFDGWTPGFITSKEIL
jgi:hypothetical protein